MEMNDKIIYTASVTVKDRAETNFVTKEFYEKHKSLDNRFAFVELKDIQKTIVALKGKRFQMSNLEGTWVIDLRDFNKHLGKYLKEIGE